MAKHSEYVFLWAVMLVAVAMGIYYGQHVMYEAMVDRLAQDKRILIIYTGGTIGMVESPDGFKPDKEYLPKELDKIMKLYPDQRGKIGQYDLVQYDPLLDSSNMDPGDWNKMLRTITEKYDEYDSFVILHGTDTMSYTASALSFGLQGLNKPVIVTGSQMSISQLKNDAINNIITSLLYASRQDALREVVIIFDDLIIRGNRSKKVSPNKYQAFGSPNFPILAKYGTDFEYDVIVNEDVTPPVTKYRKMWKNQGVSLTTRLYKKNTDVRVIWFVPGINFDPFTDEVMNVSQSGNGRIDAYILMTFGIGNGPESDKKFGRFLDTCNQYGVVLYNVSQCCQGKVDEGDYATGSFLQKHKVVSGNDMTVEAAYAKAHYLAGLFPGNADMQRNAFQENICGELSGERNFELFYNL